MCLRPKENFRGGGGEKGEESEAHEREPSGKEGGGRTPDPLFRTPTLRPPHPTHASPSPEGAIERGVGGPHAPHPQPRPGGKRAGRLDSPLRSAGSWRDLPQARGSGLYGPLYSLGQGHRGPQRRGRGPRRGRSCKQPQRPGLASKSSASQAPPPAAGAPSRPRGRPSWGPGERRGVRFPSRRARASRRAVPAAEKGEVRTYLSLLSTPSWIHLSTSPQSIMGKKEPLK